MTPKSLRTFVQILLLGLLLGTTSSVYADAISISSGSVTNVQIVPTFGTVVFTAQSTPATAAGAVLTDGFDGPSNRSQSPTRSEASITNGLASAGAVSDFTSMSFSANSSVILSDCRCQWEAEGQSFLGKSFMIVGGSGNVDVNISALLVSMQSLTTDQFSFFAASDVLIGLQVSDPSNSSVVHTFSFASRHSIRPPTDSMTVEIQRQLSEAVTLLFNKEYILRISIFANSRAGQNEIPEPATVVLLVSGLGFMGGFVKKWRRGL
jgi:hypothetical protein